ncbi:MAG: hypothetical protein SF187_20610 [Deltaproteobacteria bacterium]|nr:hypothetical protein [Deltaproteobacteria bacterium]
MTVSSSRWPAGALAVALVFTGFFAACDDSDSDSPDGGFNPDAAATGGSGGSPGTGGGPAQGGSDGGVDSRTDGATDAGGDTAPIVMAEPDVDMVFVRFNTNGTIDNDFGTAGVATLNLSGRAGSVYDTPASIARDAQNRLVVFGGVKGKDRSDADRVVFRLTDRGALDTTFVASPQFPSAPANGINNVYVLNMGNVADNARRGIVQSDGKIISSGYSPLPTGVGTQTANAIVLLRLNADGTPDNGFGVGGVSVSNPFRSNVANTLWGYAEAYSVGLQDSNYVTTGYGRAAATGTVDVISARFNASGALDTTFGNQGASVVDLSATSFDDRGRDLAMLPDGRIVVAGSTATAAGTAAIDGLVAVLTKDGGLDTTFNTTGYKAWDLGRANDAFFGVATSTDGKVAVVAGASTGNNQDDDAVIGVIPLDGTGTAAVKLDPVSDSGHDRFAAVAFGTEGKFYAAGFVAESDKDTALVVVRYNADGTRDNTFGAAGVAKKNVSVGNGILEAATALVVQADGKVVLAGRAEGN